MYRFVMAGRPLVQPVQHYETRQTQVVDIEARGRATSAAASITVRDIDRALRAAQSRRAAAAHRPPAGIPIEHRTCGRILDVS